MEKVTNEVSEFRQWKEIPEILIKRGEELVSQPYRKIKFTGDLEADDLLNDIVDYPHAFVLACVMDRQIKAELAWLIPYKVSQVIGGFEFSRLVSLELGKIKDIFVRRGLHRFNDIMSQNFYSAILRIHSKYDDDASNIWKRSPKSATIVRKFLQFQGVGIKIASMAVNILTRDFKIPVEDKLCIDISPDVHVKRVLSRLGFIDKDATAEEIVYFARELNPAYPVILDLSVWEIGKEFCRSRNPNCGGCYLQSRCPKILE